MVKENLKYLFDEINNCCEKFNRNIDDVQLIAVSKTIDIDKMLEAYEFGIRDFGENLTSEIKRKSALLSDYEINWHMIGQLQSNKVKDIIDITTLIHSVDRKSLIDEIEKRSEKLNKKTNILIQINHTENLNRGGIASDDLKNIIKIISEKNHLNICGLMCVAPHVYEEKIIEEAFFNTFLLLEELKSAKICNIKKPILSMGMSSDYKLAIKHGSTHLRIGSLIFGRRNY